MNYKYIYVFMSILFSLHTMIMASKIDRGLVNAGDVRSFLGASKYKR
jgi:uncharacterized membrane protein